MSASQRAFRAVTRPASGSLLRIVSYNVLANKYVLTGYHDYCEKEFTAWDYRLPRLCQEIDNLQGDIICLQEVEEGVFRDEIGQHLQNKGFQGWHHPRSSQIKGPKEGPCLFVRTSIFDIHAHKAACLHDALADSQQGPFWDIVRADDREDGAVLALLTHKETGRKLLAACTHLFWNPTFPDIKLAQAELLCKMIVSLLKEHGEDLETPVILGGDFNSLWGKSKPDLFDQVPPGECLVSGVCELLTKGVVTRTHHDHPASRRGAADVPDFTSHGLIFKSSYKLALGRDPTVTNATSNFYGCLDYIFLKGAFEVTGVLELPYEDGGGGNEMQGHPHEVDFGPIPDKNYPSDHLSIACEVALH